jgi:hypothetical protein
MKLGLHLALTNFFHESGYYCGQLRAQRVAYVKPLHAQLSIFRMRFSNEHALVVRPTDILAIPYGLHDFA